MAQIIAKTAPTGKAHMLRRSRAQAAKKADEETRPLRAYITNSDKPETRKQWGIRNKLLLKGKLVEAAKIAPLTAKEERIFRKFVI